MLLRDIQRSAEEQQAAAQDMKARRRAVSQASVLRCLLCCRVPEDCHESVPGSLVRCACSGVQALFVMRCHPKLHQLLELEKQLLAEHINCGSCPRDVRACHLQSVLLPSLQREAALEQQQGRAVGTSGVVELGEMTPQTIMTTPRWVARAAALSVFLYRVTVAHPQLQAIMTTSKGTITMMLFHRMYAQSRRALHLILAAISMHVPNAHVPSCTVSPGTPTPSRSSA